MKTRSSSSSIFLFMFALQVFGAVNLSLAQDFDFSYFVLQWPASYCDTKKGCCFPTTGKPAQDFGIHGLWPNYNDGTYPSSCDKSAQFDPSEISDLIPSLQRNWPTLACPSGDGTKFWEHEWEKHGTCTTFTEREYFEIALRLKEQIGLLDILTNAGITPKDGKYYSIKTIRDAITEGLGFTPGIECNVDSSGNSQLYQIYICVDTLGTELINCPVYPRGKCSSKIEFPSLEGDSLMSNTTSMVVSS